MKSDIELRQFRPDDLERILAIERDSFARDAWNKKLFLDYFRECPELFLVAMLRRRIAGYIITCAGAKNAELLSIAVHSRDRRGGVGKALLDDTAARLRARGIKTWWLMVEAANQPAIRFYEKYGFKCTRPVKGYYGPGRDAWRMRLMATTTNR